MALTQKLQKPEKIFSKLIILQDLGTLKGKTWIYHDPTHNVIQIFDLIPIKRSNKMWNPPQEQFIWSKYDRFPVPDNFYVQGLYIAGLKLDPKCFL